jgi:hypothetical protein
LHRFWQGFGAGEPDKERPVGKRERRQAYTTVAKRRQLGGGENEEE